MIDQNELGAEALRRGFARDLAAVDDRDYVFLHAGGAGDALIVTECAAALRRRFADSTARGWRFLLACEPAAAAFLRDFNRRASVYDEIREVPAGILLGLDWRNASALDDMAARISARDSLALDATPWGVSVEALSLHDIWGHMLFKWGAPADLDPQAALQVVATEESRGAWRAHFAIPDDSPCILLAPDARSARSRKAWPDSAWRELIASLARLSPQSRLLVLSDDPAWPEGLGVDTPLLSIDRRRVKGWGLAMLLDLLSEMNAVVAVDSLIAHAAGVARAPCVTLWGPTSPLFFGRRKNTNVRASTCPPCHWTSRAEACERNVCMEAVKPALVTSLVAPHLRHAPLATTPLHALTVSPQ